jgi:SpoVK/Ycf46/Vps4 family AAA+-type ATPase
MNIFDLIINDKEVISLTDVVLTEDNRIAINQVIQEHQHVKTLTEYGLPVNNKILLQGSSGCGKTMTAKALAHALGKNLLLLNLSNIVCSKIGETSQNIKMVFDRAAREKAVLFLDEFDQIAKARGNDDKDVGEMRRLVNSLIQLIDLLPNDVLLLCATNHPEIIDIAIMRRFQIKVKYELPDKATLNKYYDKLLERFPSHLNQMDRVYHISFAEAKDYALTRVKANLLQELTTK